MAKKPLNRDLGDQRGYFKRVKLDPSTLSDCPVEQFSQWYATAEQYCHGYPNPGCLATVDDQGQPVARIVLLKGFDVDGFYFYSNYRSRKGQHMEQNPRVSMCFLWEELERQVIITGTVSKINASQSDKYFATRPRGSQLGAHVSQQSQMVENRDALELELERWSDYYKNQEVPRPPHWGGYRIQHNTVEFWQGQPDRLHDRFEYRRAESSWQLQRLAP